MRCALPLLLVCEQMFFIGGFCCCMEGRMREEDMFDEQDIDEFVAGCVKRLCIFCGAPLPEKPTGRRRRFCSDACRSAYWKRHPCERWECIEVRICPVCGRTFLAQKGNTRRRKYCSRACANRGRAMEKKGVL